MVVPVAFDDTLIGSFFISWAAVKQNKNSLEIFSLEKSPSPVSGYRTIESANLFINQTKNFPFLYPPIGIDQQKNWSKFFFGQKWFKSRMTKQAGSETLRPILPTN